MSIATKQMCGLVLSCRLRILPIDRFQSVYLRRECGVRLQPLALLLRHTSAFSIRSHNRICELDRASAFHDLPVIGKDLANIGVLRC